MPVKITSDLNSTDPRAITLSEYEDGRANFEMHYFLGTQAQPFDGGDFAFQWDDLNNAVNNFVATSGVPLNEVCIRFVHCFEIPENKLYLRAQICRMVETPIIDYGKQVYSLDDSACSWYSLKQDECMNTPIHTLKGVEYFDSFYYKAMEGAQEMECLNTPGPDRFVRNIVFPWQDEILQMYIDNGSPEGAFVNFGSCSYTHNNPGDDLVEWPHGLVIYLSTAEGVKMLSDGASITIFENRGADVGTCCPPMCNAYLKPNVI